METVYVIGSGPSGIGCALGLLARNNIKVVMLDVGKTLEQEKLENRLQNNNPIIYPEKKLPWENKNKTNIFNKHLFGSVYPYDIDHAEDEFDISNAVMRASFARGGLSNVWGASIMPYRNKEIEHWPISVDTMNLYYKKILNHIPVSTCLQDYFNDWPDLPASAQKYTLGEQAQHLWQRYLTSKDKLNSHGILVGGARLAIYQTDTPQQKGCVYCGECMYGCTQDAIYSTRHTLRELKKNPLFEYLPGFRVDQLSEHAEGVTINAYHVNDRSNVTFTGKKVFLAAGVIMSTHLLTKSLSQLKEMELHISDSQHFLLPSIMFRHFKGLHKKPSLSISQLFYEIIRPDFFNESVHLQLHTYINLYENEFEKKIKFLKNIRGALYPLYERLIVLQGYLPAGISGSISARLNPQNEKLIVKGNQHDDSLYYVKKIIRLFTQNAFRLGFMPLIPACRMSQVGVSNHYGGNFPMKKNPLRPNESDCFGSPFGMKRIHVVDACVLPSIQAQSVTLTSMANAYRIGYTCRMEIS